MSQTREKQLELGMYCYQCEQTSGGKACTRWGVCGKSPEVAALQDLLLHTVKGLGIVVLKANEMEIYDDDTDKFTYEAVFSTLTNVNFDPERFHKLIDQAIDHRESLKKRIAEAGGNGEYSHDVTSFIPATSKEERLKQGRAVGIDAPSDDSPDVHALKWLLIYGIKGVAAYADHAQILDRVSSEIPKFIYRGLAETLREDITVGELVGLAMECGQVNLTAMKLLDSANTGTYGHPVPTDVPLGQKKGKSILVSGHDLRDMELILKASENKGINVYTHGEMLPTHGYPELKKYSHFYGHYGTAWQNQKKEFAAFPGAILMTTNCIQEPVESYQGNIYTTGLVGWPGVKHVESKDFTPIIEKALEMSGFTEDTPGKSVKVGFARKTVMSVAGTVIDAVKSGAIRHFFLVGGCDGAKPGRSYYTEFVEKTPKDTVVLTLACGKFRFFDMDLGEIGGLPRLMDVGQCNDAYSAVQIAVALAEAFGVGVNDLPLSIILSWYEQKAVAILLSLLSLGIKNIRLGPSLPAFITPNVLNVLVEKFNIMPISTPDEDLKAILG